MLKRMVENWFPRQSEQTPINYEDIVISEEAKRILTQSLDVETINHLIENCSPLHELYRKPEEALKKIAENPILKVETGATPTMSSRMKYLRSYQESLQIMVPTTEYFFDSHFSINERESGECSDIVRWFLYDIKQSGVTKILSQKNIHLSVGYGNSPTFFNNPEARHLWLNMQSKAGSIIIDPAFGVITQNSEKSEYKKREEIAVEKFLASKTGPFRIQGWTDLLEDGGICPANDKPESPYGTMLGLSKNGEYAYRLCFETNRDTPFISIRYPNTSVQEIYWVEMEENSKGHLGMMTSELSHAPIDMAYANPVAQKETDTMLQTMLSFRFEGPTFNDPRLQGIFFGYI